MKPVRKHLIYVLLVALPLSSWAGLAAQCVQDSELLPIQVSIVVDAHAHHANGLPDSVAQDDESASGDCACCGDCASICPASSCSPAEITSQAFEISIGGDSRAKALADLFHASPAPHPLIRPPIAVS
jgi:ferredoxin